MECNKDEAIRSKEISEKKFLANDICGAKKFALKAQSLYPGLENISQMLATFEVYISAENKVNGEADWYGVLGVNPWDDYETLKRNYRKHALMLHPDKSRSIGAEGAFKYVSEAWSLLSDKAKRAAFDVRTKAHRKTTSYGVSSANPSKNGVCNFTKTNVKTEKNGSSNAQYPKYSMPPPGSSHSHGAGHRATSGSSSKPRSETFWVPCRQCMMPCEIVEAYSNGNLRCHCCKVEFSPPVRPVRSCTQQNRNPTEKAASENMWSSGGNERAFNNSTPGSCSDFNWVFPGTSSAVHAAFVVQQAYEKVKKTRKEAQAKAKRVEAVLHRKNSKRMSSDSSKCRAAKRTRVVEDNTAASGESKPTCQMGGGVGNCHEKKGGGFETDRVGRDSGKHGIGKGLSQLDIRNFFMKKVKNETDKKPRESVSATGVGNAAKEQISQDKKVHAQASY